MTDRLLEWLSFRGGARRPDIPAELLSGEQALRVMADFVVLGHADALADGWRIAPPVLAAAADEYGASATGILCGARTPAIVARLSAACSAASALLAETPQPRRPTVVTVTARSPTDLAAIAADAGLRFQRDAAFTLLACVPTINEWPRMPCEMVVGRVQAVKRFSRSRLSWLASTLEEATQAPRGFFRIRRDWDWVNILKQGVNQHAYIDIPAGRLAVAAHSKAVRWDWASSELALPIILFPPMLMARALVLCSGRLPVWNRTTRTVSFQSVPARVTRLTLAATGLRLA